MKVLNNVIISVFSTAHQAYTEKTISFIRPNKITYKGAARMIQKEHGYSADSFSVVRIETSIFA
jgi:hypothetical protein